MKLDTTSAMSNCNLLFVQFLILILSIHLQHISIVNSQEGQVDDESKDPTLHPTLQPTTEFPKYVTFSMSILMSNANFDVDMNGGNGELTLDSLFRRTLCLCTFSFPANQCHKRIIKYSPNPTTSPTTEPTFDPTYDPTTDPTYDPTMHPSFPTLEPTIHPTFEPSNDPTFIPTPSTKNPTNDPTNDPTIDPTNIPTNNPTNVPTFNPTQNTINPTNNPTVFPSTNPTFTPTITTNNPSGYPTFHPSSQPSPSPTVVPSTNPTSQPSTNPTFEPTFEPTLNPTMEPTLNPTMEPTLKPTMVPTMVPTIIPTTDPTMEPTLEPVTRRRIRRLSDDTSTSTSTSIYKNYDLNLQFFVMVINRKDENVFYQRIKSYYFFNEFKQCLLDSLNSPYVLNNYKNTSIIQYEEEIGSMQISPLNDINILSPTYSPTSYPTYNYKQGEDYGYWMIALGICLIVAVIAYWLYTRYTIHQDYKAEQKSAPPNNIELQTLFGQQYKD